MFRYRKRNAAFTWISVIWIVIMIGVFIAVILNHWKSSAYEQGYADAYALVSEAYDKGYTLGYSDGYVSGSADEQKKATNGISSDTSAVDILTKYGLTSDGYTLPSSTAPTAPAQPKESIGLTVYITGSGKKYHSASCSYLSKSKIPISLDDAIVRRYTACSKCW